MRSATQGKRCQNKGGPPEINSFELIIDYGGDAITCATTYERTNFEISNINPIVVATMNRHETMRSIQFFFCVHIGVNAHVKSGRKESQFISLSMRYC